MFLNLQEHDAPSRWCSRMRMRHRLGAGEMNPSSEDEAEMYKRMLRSVLATVFVGALAFGTLAAQGAEDITWTAPKPDSRSAASVTLSGDITWGVTSSHPVA
ncbi:hypothetical protein AAGT00_17365 [Streptomyces cavourensis]|uniref:Uncharacterized protein n=1 Tax=Streptomyces bacillaris TaxID=68179 RepID=A0ABW6DS87_9ACTN|nr:hypothetical protein [Streptomyces nanshensis]